MSSQVDPRAGQKPPFHEPEQPHPGRQAQMRNQPDYGEETYVGHGRLSGRVALVTGADSGIGRAVALAFAREGADVGIAYLDEHDDARETQRVVEAEGRRALLLPGDVGDPAHCREIVERTVRELGRLDVLVNDAAFQGKAVESFDQIDPERIERTFRTNVEAMFFTVRAALPHLEAGSAIINVASIQAYKPSPAILDYAATKGAVVAFTKGLAQELAKKGVRVNCVAPGPVWTPLVVQSFDEQKIEQFGANDPLQRPAQPVEVAPAFVFLASDESRFVNGEVLGVTGGQLLA
ncbi:MAG TPA: glucose 1-dehydrogenase [Polyangiaceae bacterium]|nr:glucose 1-dehydrogenase [Polyangiaceae bacterium]